MNRWLFLVAVVLVSGVSLRADDPVKKAKPSLDDDKKAITGLWYNLGDKKTKPIAVRLYDERITVCRFDTLTVVSADSPCDLAEKDGKRYIKNGEDGKETLLIAYELDGDRLTLNGRIVFFVAIDLKGTWKRAK